MQKPQTYYGFSSAKHPDGSVWFHTKEAAERFAKACGWSDVTIETCEDPEVEDIMDTAGMPWRPTV